VQLELKLGILSINTQESVLVASDNSLAINIEQRARNTTLRPDQRIVRDRGRKTVIGIAGAIEGLHGADLNHIVSTDTNVSSFPPFGMRIRIRGKLTSFCSPLKK
jgi:hypothetical protein